MIVEKSDLSASFVKGLMPSGLINGARNISLQGPRIGDVAQN